MLTLKIAEVFEVSDLLDIIYASREKYPMGLLYKLYKLRKELKEVEEVFFERYNDVFGDKKNLTDDEMVTYLTIINSEVEIEDPKIDIQDILQYEDKTDVSLCQLVVFAEKICSSK
jgi:hypothetical protein